MSETFVNAPMPRRVLLAAVALIGFALVTAASSRYLGIGTMSATSVAAALESRELRFEDRPDGAIAVYDAKTNETVDVLSPGTYGFVRVAIRGLARGRKLRDVGSSSPFRLTLWADHRYSLDDPATGQRIDLDAFGKVNANAFERLLQREDSAS